VNELVCAMDIADFAGDCCVPLYFYSTFGYFIIIITIAICAYRERCFVTIVGLLNICDSQATASN
jgi:hypothetical protein